MSPEQNVLHRKLPTVINYRAYPIRLMGYRTSIPASYSSVLRFAVVDKTQV